MGGSLDARSIPLGVRERERAGGEGGDVAMREDDDSDSSADIDIGTETKVEGGTETKVEGGSSCSWDLTEGRSKLESIPGHMAGPGRHTEHTHRSYRIGVLQRGVGSVEGGGGHGDGDVLDGGPVTGVNRDIHNIKRDLQSEYGDLEDSCSHSSSESATESLSSERERERERKGVGGGMRLGTAWGRFGALTAIKKRRQAKGSACRREQVCLMCALLCMHTAYVSMYAACVYGCVLSVLCVVCVCVWCVHICVCMRQAREARHEP